MRIRGVPRRILVLALVLAPLVSCADSGRVEIELPDAAGPSRSASVEAWEAALGCEVAFAEDAGGVWLRWRLDPSGWERGEGGILTRARPRRAHLSDSDGASYRLESDARNYTLASPEDGKPLPGTFAVLGNELAFLVAEGDEPPVLVYSELVPRGVRARASWTVSIGGYAGRALPVWPGEAWEIRAKPAKGRSLRFYHCAHGPTDGGAELTFRVRVDGQDVWSVTRPSGERHDGWAQVALPNGAERVELAVEGAPTLSAFLAPSIGPTALPSRAPGDRSARRPDVLLFVADTFRADLLQTYGGPRALLPFVDRLAGESVVFERAWSTSTWTLPSHGSLFTGLYPPQHGAEGNEFVLPEKLRTLGEAFARNGYRTAAVTDAAFVSRRFEMNQGFEWFREHDGHERWNLDETLRLATSALEARDGRPTFLFVHTYRTHEPYRVGESESLVESQRFLFELQRELAEKGKDAMDFRRWAEEYRELYEAGARDLDAKLERWWNGLATANLTPDVFVFTSDHGEEFFEHGNIRHGGTMWEEKLRVPLFLHGPGLTARRMSHAASLVDLPRTLVGLASITPDPLWGGRDLLAADADATIFGFFGAGETRRLTIVDGGRKVFTDADAAALRAGKITQAFDLSTDPGETDDVAEREEWPALLGRKHLARLEELLRPAVEPQPLVLDSWNEETMENLRAIGYGGD